ncbi:MAG: hypothetical protein KKG04_05580, partial [Candidatus Thermoplasmatota archaeon]|nr:hypothetical protein [Candidatus Thermoplasmatota archaeon]
GFIASAVTELTFKTILAIKTLSLGISYWGIVPEDKMISPILKRKHPFAGVTTFKTGFGGQEFDLLPCQDLKISNKYHITRVIETVRRIRRGFW